MEQQQDKIFVIASTVIVDKNGNVTPCPELLTEEEAIRYLRLDGRESKQAKRTMKYYRDKGELIAIRVGTVNRYRRFDLDIFLENKSKMKREASAL